MSKTMVVVGSILLLFTLATPAIFPGNAVAGNLEEAISQAAKGTEKGQINIEAEKGYLGIPGGP